MKARSKSGKPRNAATKADLAGGLASRWGMRKDQPEPAVSIEKAVEAHRQGRFDVASKAYEAILVANPRCADALHLLGLVRHQAGQSAAAVELIASACALSPDVALYRANLAAAQMGSGMPREALSNALASLAMGESDAGRTVFASCVSGMRFSTVGKDLEAALAKAISDPWARPRSLAIAAASALCNGVDFCLPLALANAPGGESWSLDALWGGGALERAGSGPLAKALLSNACVPDERMEKLWSATRSAWLRAEESSQRPQGAGSFALLCSLASQCHLNEYAYASGSGEQQRAAALAEKAQEIIAAGSMPDPWLLAAVAAWMPLGTLKGASSIAAAHWPAPFDELVERQIREPEAEAALALAMDRSQEEKSGLASKAVRGQYEANPYPRWVKTCVPPDGLGPRAAVMARLGGVEPDAEAPAERVLIAGCGTGQHSNEMAMRHPSANFVGLDLSLASLAYAKRMAASMDLGNVDFVQGDIMALPESIGVFDAVESVGVLHHLADPMAGWKALLGVLKPGGTMKVGLYSSKARWAVEKARLFASEGGFSHSIEGLRSCRAALMESSEPFAVELRRMQDFYCLSEFRDLALHVQESCFDMEKLESSIEELGVEFLGFDVSESEERRFAAMFPDGRSKRSWSHWAAYERAYPSAFVGMYQFHIRKR